MLRFHPHTALCAQSWVGQFLLGGVADLARGPRLACYGAEAFLIPRLDDRKRPVSQLPCPLPGIALSLCDFRTTAREARPCRACSPLLGVLVLSTGRP